MKIINGSNKKFVPRMSKFEMKQKREKKKLGRRTRGKVTVCYFGRCERASLIVYRYRID